MRKTLNIEKRIGDDLARLRNLAKKLPKGQRLSVLNACDRIALTSRKGQAIIEASVGVLFPRPTQARYDARTQEDMAAQAECKKAVFAALLAGRKIDLTNAAEFRVSQMHTTIARIRKDIAARHPGLTLCDEWVRPEGTRPYKRYWIINNE